jgi:methyl-accepting chemotaxis protein
MLALNASIEAAKAGDAGKGFAVVADEVKDLAEQSQQSTSQVQKILQDIRHATDRAVMATEEGSKGVDKGMALVERSGDIMRALSEVIEDTVTSTQQIVVAIRQEAAGVDQVSTAMGEINKVTQQFVSSARQTQDAAAEIARLSGQMKEVVSIYKV